MSEWQYLVGNSLEVLQGMGESSVQTCVTSPPYWGLRDYGEAGVVWPDGWKGQLGLEPTPELYVEHLVMIFREVRRVLRDDGTLWLNLGDSYCANRTYQVADKVTTNRDNMDGLSSRVPDGMKPKDLVGIPWMVAFALRGDGWWLRSDIIWSKPNPMPESVTDRPTKAHEYLFLLTKSQRYFYDADAVREPHTTNENRPHGVVRDREYGYDSKLKKTPRPYAVIEPEFRKEIIEYRDLPDHNELRKYLSDARKQAGMTIDQIEQHFGNQAGHHWFENGGSYPSATDWPILKELLDFDDKYDQAMTNLLTKSGMKENHPNGRNKRSVWHIATKPYAEAHFAVFPEDLVEPCIKAGTPARACGVCGAPYERIIETTKRPPEVLTNTKKPQDGYVSVGCEGMGMGQKYQKWRNENPPKTIGFKPSCDHADDTGRAVVLDPFAGSGTVLAVARRLGRSGIGIDVNEDYKALADKRAMLDVPNILSFDEKVKEEASA
jgi:DNA modification methylase